MILFICLQGSVSPTLILYDISLAIFMFSIDQRVTVACVLICSVLLSASWLLHRSKKRCIAAPLLTHIYCYYERFSKTNISNQNETSKANQQNLEKSSRSGSKD